MNDNCFDTLFKHKLNVITHVRSSKVFDLLGFYGPVVFGVVSLETNSLDRGWINLTNNSWRQISQFIAKSIVLFPMLI